MVLNGDGSNLLREPGEPGGAARGPLQPGAQVVLSVAAPPPCAGDANGSGAVNFDDVTAVLGSFGTSPGPIGPGDANGDGAVSFDDVTTVLGNFGVICP